MSEVADLLTPAQSAKLERDMQALYGVGEQHDPLQDAKDAGLTEILHRDVPLFRELELPLYQFYIRLFDGRGRVTACTASKVDRWVNDGWRPATELEGDD